jgi:hypothetical protein
MERTLLYTGLTFNTKFSVPEYGTIFSLGQSLFRTIGHTGWFQTMHAAVMIHTGIIYIDQGSGVTVGCHLV